MNRKLLARPLTVSMLSVLAAFAAEAQAGIFGTSWSFSGSVDAENPYFSTGANSGSLFPLSRIRQNMPGSIFLNQSYYELNVDPIVGQRTGFARQTAPGPGGYGSTAWTLSFNDPYTGTQTSLLRHTDSGVTCGATQCAPALPLPPVTIQSSAYGVREFAPGEVGTSTFQVDASLNREVAPGPVGWLDTTISFSFAGTFGVTYETNRLYDSILDVGTALSSSVDSSVAAVSALAADAWLSFSQIVNSNPILERSAPRSTRDMGTINSVELQGTSLTDGESDFFLREVAIPIGAQRMGFLVDWAEIADGGVLSLQVQNEVLWAADSTSFSTSGPFAVFVDVSQFAGTTQDLGFVLSTDSLGVNSVFVSDQMLFSVAAPIPEPETYAMMLAGLGLLGVAARRRKVKEAAARRTASS